MVKNQLFQSQESIMARHIPKLSIIIPVYNEKTTILELLRRVEAIDLNKEIVIVDDGSIDGTKELLTKINNGNARILFHSINRGKGAAIRTGIKYVTGSVVVIQDADLEYDPNDYHRLLAPIIDGNSDVVYGSRLLNFERKNRLLILLHPKMMSYKTFFLGGLFLTWLVNVLYRANISDVTTCYKMFRKEIIKNINLKCMKFEFCPEVTVKLLKKNYKITEVPISYHPRKINEGKKINWRDGLHAIWTILKYRFVD